MTIWTIITSITYFIVLIFLIIPISSLATVVYVLIEPFQTCNLLPKLMQYLFAHFVQLPLHTAEHILQLYHKDSSSNVISEPEQVTFSHQQV